MAEALVVRQGTEPDPYWNDKAVQVIGAEPGLTSKRLRTAHGLTAAGLKIGSIGGMQGLISSLELEEQRTVVERP